MTLNISLASSPCLWLFSQLSRSRHAALLPARRPNGPPHRRLQSRSLHGDLPRAAQMQGADALPGHHVSVRLHRVTRWQKTETYFAYVCTCDFFFFFCCREISRGHNTYRFVTRVVSSVQLLQPWVHLPQAAGSHRFRSQHGLWAGDAQPTNTCGVWILFSGEREGLSGWVQFIINVLDILIIIESRPIL